MPSEQNPDTTPPAPAGDGYTDDPAARLEQELRSRGLVPASTGDAEAAAETAGDDPESVNPEDDADAESTAGQRTDDSADDRADVRPEDGADGSVDD